MDKETKDMIDGWVNSGLVSPELAEELLTEIEGATCPECEEPCDQAELDQWSMCHDCDNQIEFDE